MRLKCFSSLLVLAGLVRIQAAAEEVYWLPNGPLPIRPVAKTNPHNAFDQTMLGEMQKLGAVGASIAVTKFGKFVTARGFGEERTRGTDFVFSSREHLESDHRGRSSTLAETRLAWPIGSAAEACWTDTRCIIARP